MSRRSRKLMASKTAAVLTSVTMVFSMVPAQAFAAAPVQETDQTPLSYGTASENASSALGAIGDIIQTRAASEMPDMVEISFDANWPAQPETAELMLPTTIALDNSIVTLPECSFAVEGYDFIGWYKAPTVTSSGITTSSSPFFS